MIPTGGEGSGTDTREEIMLATYRALCEHGYANLTMQSIADEFDKTKAVLHYHYDTKDELLTAFLDYLLTRFDDRIAIEGETSDPADRLEAFIDVLLFGPEERDIDDHWDFHTALLEIRTQAPHNDSFREQLTINFESVEAMTVAIVRDGVERGRFRSVDAEQFASFLLSCISGARVHQVTLDRDDVAETTSTFLHTLVREWMCTPDGQ